MRLIRWANNTATVAAAVWLAVLLMWAYDRTPPAELRVFDHADVGYQAGDYLTVAWALEGDTAHCTLDVHSSIVDSNGYLYRLHNPRVRTVREHGGEVLSTQYRLPETFPVGEGEYRLEVHYICNPIQKLWPVTASFTSNFVVERAPSAGHRDTPHAYTRGDL